MNKAVAFSEQYPIGTLMNYYPQRNPDQTPSSTVPSPLLSPLDPGLSLGALHVPSLGIQAGDRKLPLTPTFLRSLRSRRRLVGRGKVPHNSSLANVDPCEHSKTLPKAPPAVPPRSLSPPGISSQHHSISQQQLRSPSVHRRLRGTRML